MKDKIRVQLGHSFQPDLFVNSGRSRETNKIRNGASTIGSTHVRTRKGKCDGVLVSTVLYRSYGVAASSGNLEFSAVRDVQ